MNSDGFEMIDIDKKKADTNQFKICMMLVNDLASKNQKKKSKFCESSVVLSPAVPSSILLETASDLPFDQPKVVGRGKKRMNSQAVLELEASDEQPAVKRTRAKNIRKPLQKIHDNIQKKEVLKKINMI